MVNQLFTINICYAIRYFVFCEVNSKLSSIMSHWFHRNPFKATNQQSFDVRAIAMKSDFSKVMRYVHIYILCVLFFMIYCAYCSCDFDQCRLFKKEQFLGRTRLYYSLEETVFW